MPTHANHMPHCVLLLSVWQGGRQCMRCSNGIAHSPHADFTKYAEVLVAEADVRRLSKAVLDEMDSKFIACLCVYLCDILFCTCTPPST